jgi:hypothetical protein
MQLENTEISMKNTALFVSGVLMLAVGCLHFYRYKMATPVTFGTFNVPVEWSMYGGIVMVVLALWMFIAAKR